MRLAVVVPGDDLYDIDSGPLRDEEIPALIEQPVIPAVNEVLVVGIGAVVL
jgi:hypothetical protein